MAGLKDIAKKVGLSPLRLEDGQTIDLMSMIDEMFLAIVDECRTKGGSVRIKDFGTFSARLNKGRKLKTPLMKDGEVEFGDLLLLRFHQSTVSKDRLNDGKAVEDWGGKYIPKKPRLSDKKKAKKTSASSKKSSSKKTSPKKAPPEKVSSKNAPPKNAPPKNAPPKKAPPKKSSGKKAPPKKSSSKKK